MLVIQGADISHHPQARRLPAARRGVSSVVVVVQNKTIGRIVVVAHVQFSGPLLVCPGVVGALAILPIVDARLFKIVFGSFYGRGVGAFSGLSAYDFFGWVPRLVI